MASGSGQPSCILVTGADGFVGRWLLQVLAPRLPDGGRIVGATRTGSRLPGIETVALDITDQKRVAAVVRAVRPDCLIHLAAVTAVQESRRAPRQTWSVNLDGTLNLAQAVLEAVPSARLLFASTSEVYGATFKSWTGPLHEGALLDPANPYAASKAAADLMIGQMARDGLRAIRFRPFNHTGPGQTEDFVVPAFAAQIARIERGLQEPVMRVGNLEAQRDFLDVRDVVAAYAEAALADFDSDLAAGTILNLASGTPRRISDVLQSLLDRARAPIRIEPDPDRMRPNDVPLALGDASRARSLLRWAPKVPWEATVDAVLDHWRAVAARSPQALA